MKDQNQTCRYCRVKTPAANYQTCIAMGWRFTRSREWVCSACLPTVLVAGGLRDYEALQPKGKP